MPFTFAVYPTVDEMAAAAADRAATILREAVAANGRARAIVATGNSQIRFIDALTSRSDVPWDSVHIFHMDEYAGMSDTHPASFRKWIRERVTERVRPASADYINGAAPDLAAECRRYTGVLAAAPIDVAFVGIGENGHIAFNDPHVANFNDPEDVKIVDLDEACRRQQVGEGHFRTMDEVPKQAITLTCPALLRSRNLVCCVPDLRKAEAVKASLEGPVTEQCPGSAIRTHPNARLFLDAESASLLSDDRRG